MKKSAGKDYLNLLKERKKTSRVYVSHQSTGLMLAEILDDETHKSLYMKLAKENDVEMLMQLAKDVASRKNVKKKGAYFMKLFTEIKKSKK
ncbi:MAG: hypothetical protein KJI72_01630 [Patescibacteria group bacterium]|nr:hypothetical protein [Patescibacteria group bacterium]